MPFTYNTMLFVPPFLSYVATMCTHVFKLTASGDNIHRQFEPPSFILNTKAGFNELPSQRIAYLSSLLTMSSYMTGTLVGYAQADIVTASVIVKLAELGTD